MKKGFYNTATILEALIHQSFPSIDPRRESEDLFKCSVESRKLRGGRGSLYMGQGRTEGLHTFPTPLGAPLSEAGLWISATFSHLSEAREKDKT